MASRPKGKLVVAPVSDSQSAGHKKSPPSGLPSEYGNVEVVAVLLGLSVSALNKARVTGDGPPFAKFGAAVRYYIPTVRAWAAERVRRSTSETEAA